MRNRAVLAGLGFLLLLMSLPMAQGQENFTAICVWAYHDADENGVHADGVETTLPGILATLSTAEGVVIASHITEPEGDFECFEDLTPGRYRLTFPDSPNHRATTRNQADFVISDPATPTTESTDGAFMMSLGETRRISFGAVPASPFVSAEEAAAPTENTQLDTMTRLLVALLGAVVAMIFMIGFGVVIASLIY